MSDRDGEPTPATDKRDTDAPRPAAGRARARVRRWWVPYFVLLTTLLLTAVATFYAWQATETEDRLRFAVGVRQTREAVSNRLDTYVALLRAGAGLFAASREPVTREQFRIFFERQEVQR
ncbi:MAG TPA: hypothetical protein VGV38_17740, partial [Pyrinomonadaceae bacterium]|nr:hypothetical protein [Pyrinomonadaceae bacterium]